MVFRNDETKEEREAREDIFGSKLSAPADEAPTMEVDRPPPPRQNVPLIPPNQGPSIQEPREMPRPSLEFMQPTPAHTQPLSVEEEYKDAKRRLLEALDLLSHRRAHMDSGWYAEFRESLNPLLRFMEETPVKLFGIGTNFSTSFSDPPAGIPAASSTSTAPALESHQAAISSTPFIRTAPPPTASASGGSTCGSALPSVWQGAAAGEDEAEDEEMPEINIESDSE